jgi:hypothetical protein
MTFVSSTVDGHTDYRWKEVETCLAFQYHSFIKRFEIHNTLSGQHSLNIGSPILMPLHIESLKPYTLCLERHAVSNL